MSEYICISDGRKSTHHEWVYKYMSSEYDDCLEECDPEGISRECSCCGLHDFLYIEEGELSQDTLKRMWEDCE